jgi:suppressor of ftsI
MIRRLRGPGPDDLRDIDGDIVIGRTGTDVGIEDPEVSRRHAVLRPVADGVEVEDLGSSNGTFVGGQRVRTKLTITQTATLRVGQAELTVEVVPPAVTTLRQTGIPQPDVTVQRPVMRPDVTAVRQRPGHPPSGGPPPGGPPPGGPPPGGPPPGGPPSGGPPPGGPPPGGPPPGGPPSGGPPSGGPPSSRPAAAAASGVRVRFGRSAAFGAGGLALGALLAVGLILLLGGSSKKAATTVASHCPAHFPPVIHDGFPEPEMRFSHGGVLDTSLHMSLANITVGGSTYNTGIEYDHQLPGPMLVFCPGDRVVLHLFNGTPLPTNLHVHGLHVSPLGSGDNIFVDVRPLTERTYSYQIPLDQFPGFYWYHPHLHPLVQPEEAGGAAGGIIVEGSLDERLPNIPQRIMVIQGGNRRAPGAASQPQSGTPSFGPPKPGAPPPPVGVPNLLVNGAENPTLRIRPGQLQRWRILNATSDRLLELAMPGVTFEVLAQDGVTLRNMIPERHLLISPGSRVEVLVRGGPTGLYKLSALPFHQCLKGCNPFAGPTTGVTTPKEDLLSMISTGPAAQDQLPTGPIGDPPDLRTKHVDVHRTILFTQDPIVKGPPAFLLDRHVFNPSRVDITMKLNSVEEWTLKNPAHGAAFEWHTFHIHQNSFQIVSINGRPLNYVDWQDNVTLPPNSTVVILIHPIDFVGKFVFHCHVIFHEDHGMMGVAQVLANPTPAQVNANRVVYMSPPTGRALLAASGHDSSAVSAYLLYCRHLLGQGLA